MNEKQKSKLSKLLTKWGVEPEELELFLKEYDETPDEEEPVTETEVEALDEAEPTDSPEADVPPVAEEKPECEETPVSPEFPEPAEVPEPEANLDATEAPSPIEEPVAEEPEALAPQADAKYDELKSALDGLSAKVDGLVDALSKSGVMTVIEPEQPVGIDSGEIPANSVDSGIDAVLARINAGRKY